MQTRHGPPARRHRHRLAIDEPVERGRHPEFLPRETQTHLDRAAVVDPQPKIPFKHHAIKITILVLIAISFRQTHPHAHA
jgi:hypothetical protein